MDYMKLAVKSAFVLAGFYALGMVSSFVPQLGGFILNLFNWSNIIGFYITTFLSLAIAELLEGKIKI